MRKWPLVWKTQSCNQMALRGKGGERPRPMAAPGSHRDPPTASPLVISLWEILGPHERAWWHSLSQSWSNSLTVSLQLRKHFLTVDFSIPQSLKASESLLFSSPRSFSLPPNSSLKGKECICVCPSPQANVHCLLHLNSCPDPQCALSAAQLPSSEPGAQDRVCQDALVWRQDVSMASDCTELSDTCNTPPSPAPTWEASCYCS